MQALGLLRGAGVQAVLAGDGPDLARLKEIARAQGLEHVTFAGFVPSAGLPAYYAAADILVHPSVLDAHPLAVTEAVAMGLPLVVSSRVGSLGPTDDARPGVNALEFPAGDHRALAVAIRRLADDEPLRARMSAESLAIASGRRMCHSVDALVAAVRQAVVAR